MSVRMKTSIAVALTLAALISLAGCGSYAKKETVMTEKPKAEPQLEYPIHNADNKFVTLETTLGNMTLELYRDVAPAHADSFLARTNDKFYDGTIFHRIIRGFMMQGGDPTGTGTGNAGYYLDAEFSDLPHIEGTLSMARAASPNSASCQFFVCFGKAAQLDGQYTVFGHVVNGYETLRKVAQVPVESSPGGERSKPVTDVQLIRAYQSDAQGNPL